MTKITEINYDKRLNRYRYADTGKFVSKEALANVTAKNVQIASDNILEIGDKLINEEISLKQWQFETAQALKTLHIQQYLLGRGGKAQMTQADYGSIGYELRKQYEYLEGFAKDLNRGYSEGSDGKRYPMTLERFRARLELYAEASRIAQDKGLQAAEKGRGAIAMQRFLGDARHCPDCPGYAARGVVPIGGVPLPTQDCQCRANCKCRVEYYTASQLQSLGLSLSGFSGVVNYQNVGL